MFCKECFCNASAFFDVTSCDTAYFRNMAANEEIIASIFSYIALVLWAFPVIPQIHKNYRTKSTAGLSAAMYAVSMTSATIFSAYTIYLDLPAPMILQPHIFVLSVVVVLGQILHYSRGWTVLQSFLGTLGLCLTLICIEVPEYFILEFSKAHNVNWLPLATGILSSSLSFLSFQPQIIKAFMTRDASSLSAWFMGLQIVGGFLFIASLIMQQSSAFNWVAASSYMGITLGNIILGIMYVAFRKKAEYSVDSQEVTRVGEDPSMAIYDFQPVTLEAGVFTK